jgi:predicted transcriptional regulator
MARRKTPTLTEVELEFMHVIWDAGQVTTEDVQTALRRQGRALADGSIRKVLAILLAKGYLWRQPQGRGFVYRAKVPRVQANRHMVLDLVRRAFGGSAALMVSTLLDGLPISKAELREIRRLIAEREKGG